MEVTSFWKLPATRAQGERVIVDREPKMLEGVSKAERTFRACLEGISVLGQAYIALDEPAMGYRAVIGGLQELSRAGLEIAELRARQLKPPHADDRPELIWGAFRQQLPEIMKLVELERDRNIDDPIEIEVELSPAQLAEHTGGGETSGH